MDCPPDEVLFAFAVGQISDRERSSAEAHLAQCEDCRAVLAQAALALSEAEPETASAEASPKNVGRYELVELLGAGTSGIVYRALDPELERVVALKILRGDEAGSAQAKERTLREARAMAQLSHPNVVTIFDVGLDAGGLVYIVMEYVPGTTLEQWLHEDTRTPEEIVAAFVEAGRGLAAAHAKRLVHRDFKPENVLVGRDGRVRVTDFGLARNLGEVESALLSGLKRANVTTRTREIFGTPAYMAPELFEGHVADARSDQFSFSVVLLGALLGHHPFGAHRGIQMAELVLRMQAGDVDFSGASMPTTLRRVLLRGVKPNPAARFSDMPALIAALERAVEPRRRAGWVSALAVLALGLLAIAVFGRGHAASPAAGEAGRAAAVAKPVSPLAARAAAVRQVAATPLSSAAAPSTADADVPAAKPPRTPPARRKAASGRKRYQDELRDPF